MKTIRDYLNILQEAQLNELADAPYPYSLYTDDIDVIYTFKAKEYHYIVKFMKIGFGDKSEYRLTFRIDLQGDENIPDDIDFDAFGIMKTGDAFRVFATVAAVLKQFITDRAPEKLDFSSAEPSRTKLYNSLFTRLRQQTKGYTFHKEGRHFVISKENNQNFRSTIE